MPDTSAPVTPRELITHFRVVAHEYFPYLSSYVYCLNPVERPGLGTMAVDQQGRMYYCPEFCERLTLDQGAYVVLHEAWHLILRHCHRAKDIIGDTPTPQQRRRYNIAVDLVVWELMAPMAEHAPEGCVTWEKMKQSYPALEPNMLPGEIYSIMTEEDERPTPPGPSPQPEPQSESDDPPEDEEQAADDTNPVPDENGEMSDEPGDDITGGFQPGTSSEPAESDEESSGGAAGEDSAAEDDFDLIGGGSAADGIPRDYEEEPDDQWDAFVEDQLLEALEKKIEEHEQHNPGRGSVPGVLKDTIKAKLRPQPNPWDRLRASVQMAARNTRGSVDHTYQKVNRRQFAIPNAPRLKGEVRYSPKAVVVIDTSASMTVACKRKCLCVMAQGLTAVGEFPVIFGDTHVRADVKYRKLTDEVEMPGGGGTDMVSLLEYAEEKYSPDVIIIGTDGGTEWPSRMKKAQLVIALTQEVWTPEWATTVRIPDMKESQ